MRLEKLLSDRKGEIVDRWFNAVIDTYAPETARIFKSRGNRFANPVAASTLDSLQEVFSGLLQAADTTQLATALDPLVRIRAVQNFTPSQATGFIFTLKTIIRNILRHELRTPRLADQLPPFEKKIDDLALTAFDVYMQCREKIYDLKAGQERNSVYRAFARAGLISEISEDGPYPESN